MIKIVQQNLNSFKYYSHPKDVADKFYEGLMRQLLDEKHEKPEKPDIMLFTEFGYALQKNTIISMLEKDGFEVILPKEYDRTNTKTYAACMMAIKADQFSFEYNPNHRIHIPESKRDRYIEGTLTLRESQKTMEIFLIYVQQAYVKSSVNKPKESYSYEELQRIIEEKLNKHSELLEEKAKMLIAARDFCKENSQKAAFLGGDLNTALNGTTSMEPLLELLYEDFVDSDLDRDKPTWKNKRLDYALVSKALKDLCRTTHLPTISDHCALVTILDLE